MDNFNNDKINARTLKEKKKECLLRLKLFKERKRAWR